MGRDLQAERVEARRQRAYRRLGTTEPECSICPESRPECLERHHPAGRKFTDETVIVCANCHTCVSDPAADQRQDLNDHKTARLLDGLADLLHEHARVLRGAQGEGT